MSGAMRVIFQALCMPGIIAPFPAVEGLRGDAKIATGETGVLVMGFVVIKPLKSLPGFL